MSDRTEKFAFLKWLIRFIFGASENSKPVNEATLARAKAIAASETSTNASFETFWLDGIRGEEPWAKAGKQMKYYADTDADGTFLVFNALPQQSPQYERTQADYDGFWTVRLDVIEN